MKLSYQVWTQIKSITASELMNALVKDGWSLDSTCGAIHVYLKSGRRVSVHFHPKKTFGEKLLRGLLADTGWDDSDARRLKLAK